MKTGSDINSLIKNATSVTFDYFDNWKNKFSNWNSGYESASNDGNIRMFSSGNDKYILSHGMIMANAICNEMFYKCYKITNLSFNNFYTDNVTEMRYMLALGYDGEGMGDLSYLDELSFNTSKVTDMSYMFCSTKLSSTLDLSNLDTSNVTSMAGMFQRCNVEVLNLSNFDTSNVTSMGGMFSTCPTLTSLDLSSFDTSNVTNMSAMFNYCSSLKTIYVSDKWHMTSEANSSTSITGMFSNCTSLVGGNGTKYDSSNAKATYARIDDPTNGKPGYFTYKAAS